MRTVPDTGGMHAALLPSMRGIHILGAFVLAGACATAAPPPTNMMVESRASVRIAEQTGAQRDPEASRYLALARRQIADAQGFIAVGAHWSAERSLESAQVNAELASELARKSHARAEAAEVQEQIRQLGSSGH